MEVGIAANHRDAVQTLHAADAALECAIAELGTVPMWDAVLGGGVTSWFHDGAGAVAPARMARRLDVAVETGLLRCGAPPCLATPTWTSRRPRGPGAATTRGGPCSRQGRWLSLLRDAAPAAAPGYLVVWVG